VSFEVVDRLLCQHFSHDARGVAEIAGSNWRDRNRVGVYTLRLPHYVPHHRPEILQHEYSTSNPADQCRQFIRPITIVINVVVFRPGNGSPMATNVVLVLLLEVLVVNSGKERDTTLLMRCLATQDDVTCQSIFM